MSCLHFCYLDWGRHLWIMGSLQGPFFCCAAVLKVCNGASVVSLAVGLCCHSKIFRLLMLTKNIHYLSVSLLAYWHCSFARPADFVLGCIRSWLGKAQVFWYILKLLQPFYEHLRARMVSKLTLEIHTANYYIMLEMKQFVLLALFCLCVCFDYDFIQPKIYHFPL